MSKLFEYAIDINNLHNLEDYISENGKDYPTGKYIDDMDKINEILDCNIADYIKSSINSRRACIKKVQDAIEQESDLIEQIHLYGIALVDMDSVNMFDSTDGEDYLINFENINENIFIIMKKDFSRVKIILKETE